MSIAQREAWLLEVASLLQPEFQQVTLVKTPPKYRVSVGFPSSGKRGKAIGECWAANLSKDAHHEIFIHPVLDEPVSVAATLTHEMAHAYAGLAAKHGPLFKKVVTPLGLVGPMKSTTAGDVFKQLIAPILKKVGDYPHAALTTGGVSSRGPKQSTRMIKVACGECGYTVRSSMKWILTGVPACPNEECGNHGEPMEAAV